MIDMHLKISLSESDTKAFIKHASSYGYDASKITETLIRNFIQRAALLKVEDDRVLQEAYEMQLKHNSKGE